MADDPVVEERGFLNVMVQPSHGKRKCLITWQTAADWDDSDFYVYRSPTGVGEWTALNEDPIRQTDAFEDTEMYREGRLSTFYYRVIAERKDAGETLIARSEAVGFFEILTRSQYGAVNKIMWEEARRMRYGNGVEVFHYIPLTSGTLSSNYDKETGQVIGTCADDESYGQRYKGGYSMPPCQTYVEFETRGPTVVSDREDGTGSAENVVINARMLAYPRPRRGHLIIHPATDDRFVVDENVDRYMFRGLVPVAFKVKLQLLRRGDARYKVPVPALESDLLIK